MIVFSNAAQQNFVIVAIDIACIQIALRIGKYTQLPVNRINLIDRDFYRYALSIGIRIRTVILKRYVMAKIGVKISIAPCSCGISRTCSIKVI